MISRPVLIGTLAYLALTFPLAVVWHMVVFKGTYELIGYFGRSEPRFLYGFLSILIQGGVLSCLFPVLSRGDYSIQAGLRFAAILGVFHWTVHVLAYAAKGDLQRLGWFIPLETVYLGLQFATYGLLIGPIYRRFGKAI